MSLNRVKDFVQINAFFVLFLQSVTICEGLDAHITLDVKGEGFHRLDFQ